MNNDDLMILDVRALADRLGRTEASIRGYLQRADFTAIPRPMRLGRRLAWTTRQVSEFIDKKEREALGDGARSSGPRKRGRPRKSESLKKEGNRIQSPN